MQVYNRSIEFTAQIGKLFSFDHLFESLYLRDIKSYKNLSPYFGHLMIDEIKVFEVDRWIGIQVEAGYANSTIIKHRVLLKRIEVRWEFLPNDNAVNNHRKIALGDFRQRFLNPK